MRAEHGKQRVRGCATRSTIWAEQRGPIARDVGCGEELRNIRAARPRAIDRDRVRDKRPKRNPILSWSDGNAANPTDCNSLL
eukprot:5759242-Pyramimonas_sp.AAC.1